MNTTILVLNAGSSSIKFAAFEAGTQARVLSGQVGNIGRDAFVETDGVSKTAPDIDDHGGALRCILDVLEDRNLIATIGGVGHRVVHGGDRFDAPVRVDGDTITALEALAPLAPHHQPHNVGAIRHLARRHPELAQVACFDTAFHQTQPAVARWTGLPRDYAARGIRRYGFHGLSYQSLVDRFEAVTGHPLPRRVIALHLGNGASMAAIENGQSIATTMGFSTLDGIPMATRSGAVDPGVLIHLMATDGLDAAGIEDLLYNRSGLLGLSGTTADMRALLESKTAEAEDAVTYYCYRIAREIGSLAAAMGGVDAIAFTGGIGENAPAIRERICTDAAWLGVGLDNAANAAGGPRLSPEGTTTSAWIIPADEEGVIARMTHACLGLG